MWLYVCYTCVLTDEVEEVMEQEQQVVVSNVIQN